MMKQTPPRDALSPVAPVFSQTFDVVATLIPASDLRDRGRDWVHATARLLALPRWLAGPPPGRSPPFTLILLQA